MPNDSKHLLPINSLLFNTTSQASLRTPVLSRNTNPTLVNIREAADTTVTALPAAPVAAPKKNPDKKKVSAWRKVVGKVLRTVGMGKKKGVVIGEPTGFTHVRTGGVVSGGDEREWVDV
jgi:hypothetical protein